MKTTQLLEFEKKLSILNDRYAHYLFVWDQFNIQNENLFNNIPDKLTTEIFPENISSKQFNVKIDYLVKSHEETQNFILNSLFILSYSIFERYLIEVHKFAKSLDDSILELNQKLENLDNASDDTEDNVTFDKFINRLNLDIDKIDNEEKYTLDYIRLRRNRIIHDSLSTQGKILNIISHHGTKLNRYWDNNLRKGRYKIDFSLKDISTFDKLELFDLLNIIRKFTLKVDTLVTNRIGEDLLLKFMLSEFLKGHQTKIKNLKIERIKKKFLNYCQTKYSYNIDISKINESDFKVT